jgi:3'-phosphoadenosine 5'-phosphosulfate sulfotransferase (PAPS reductase)/FAD synthetase
MTNETEHPPFGLGSNAGLCVTQRRTPADIVAEALERYKPVAIYAGFSGGNDSRAITHWMMSNVPGCQALHINTGIGIEASRQYVRDTCKAQGWPLTEIRAKEDCGEDYDANVLRHGFPGPDGHQFIYRRLKERAVYALVKRAKVGHPRSAKVLIATGVRHDESVRRMGYAGREINKTRAQIWTNPIYWWTKTERDAYNAVSGLPENQVAKQLGMSGECGCGAFAHPGELAKWRAIDPSFGARIDRLQSECLARGFTWGWEGRPPKAGFNRDQISLFEHPLCVGCEKSAIVKAELADEVNS